MYLTMKKLLLTIAGALIAPFAAFAAAPKATDDKYGIEATAGQAQLANHGSLPETIGKIISAALGLTGTIFLLLMIYGGFRWMQARGSEEHVTKAKEIIWSAIIGLIIIGAAYAITSFIVGRIG